MERREGQVLGAEASPGRTPGHPWWPRLRARWLLPPQTGVENDLDPSAAVLRGEDYSDRGNSIFKITSPAFIPITDRSPLLGVGS